MEFGFTNLLELEEMAHARLPRATFEYIAGGAEDEVSLRRNREAFSDWALRPRVLTDVAHVDPSTTVLGEKVSMPVLVAPTSFHGLVNHDGELATTLGAAEAGTLMVVSTLATRTLEEIASHVPAPRWFQLYVYKDRKVTEDLVHRAAAAGYRAICLTVDAPRLGRREKDERNRFTLPPNLTIAVDHGVDGIVVSNHGGRQLDSTLGTLDALPEVVAAVWGRVEVYMDGGVRRGTDVLKALALGARAVLLGRSVLWGLALGGADGVRAVLDHLRAEFELAMALGGCTSCSDVGASL